MLNAAFKQYSAERRLLNGRFSTGTSEMDATEPMELVEDDRDDDGEAGGRETDGPDESSNKLAQLHAGAGVVVFSPPPGGLKA